MKKIKKRKSLKKSVGSKNIFFRALGSAFAGLPISYGLNVIVLIPMVVILRTDYPDWLIAGVVAIPFFWASVARMYSIDYMWFKYKINIDPKDLLERLYNGIEKYFVEYVIEGTGSQKASGDIRKLSKTGGKKRRGLQSFATKFWGYFIQPKSSVHVGSSGLASKVSYDSDTRQSNAYDKFNRP